MIAYLRLFSLFCRRQAFRYAMPLIIIAAIIAIDAESRYFTDAAATPFSLHTRR